MKLHRNLASYKKKLWKLVSEFVRRLNSDNNGYTICFLCGKVYHWKEMDCAHYKHNRLDYDIRNLQTCCKECNQFKDGRPKLFREKLINKYGIEAIEQLEFDADQKGNDYSLLDVLDLINQFKKGLKILDARDAGKIILK